jgi:hypothetical protein
MIKTLPFYTDLLSDLYAKVEKVAKRNKAKCYGYWPEFDEVKDDTTYIIAGENNIISEFTAKNNDGYILRYTMHIFSRYKGYKKVNNIKADLLSSGLLMNEDVVYSELNNSSSIIEEAGVTHTIIAIDYYIMR